MHIRNAMSFLALAAAVATLNAQAPGAPAGATAPAAPARPQAAAPATAADLLQPALSNARATLMALKLEKWKKGTVRDEAESNVNALLSDLDNNIQPLIAATDAAPGRLSRAIPLLKHLDAFYDVLLRVEEASRVAAPPEQIDALEGALLRVSQSRIAFDDVLQTQAAGEEKQIVDLQTAVRAEQQNVKDAQHQVEVAKAAAAKPAPCKPATPVHRRRRRRPEKKAEPAKPSTQPAQQPQKPQ